VAHVLQVQLSTYGDSLGKDLKELRSFIDSNLQGELLITFTTLLCAI